MTLPTNKHAALRLMASGRATIAEVAKIVGITRQSVREWTVNAGLDVTKARAEFLAKLWQRHNRGADNG
jgi:transposase-like protein